MIPLSKGISFNGDGNTSYHPEDVLAGIGHFLVAPTRQVSETTGHWVFRNNTRTDLVGYKDDGAGGGYDGPMKPVYSTHDPFILTMDSHQVADPQRQAIDQQYIGSRPLLRYDPIKRKWFLHGFPVVSALLPMAGDAFDHFGIIGLAGGDKQIETTDGLFAKGQSMSTFAAAASADDKGRGNHAGNHTPVVTIGPCFSKKKGSLAG
jgi:hypothetical protein